MIDKNFPDVIFSWEYDENDSDWILRAKKEEKTLAKLVLREHNGYKQVSWIEKKSKEKEHKGLATHLYLLTIRKHKVLYSDSLMWSSAHKIWDRLALHSDVLVVREEHFPTVLRKPLRYQSKADKPLYVAYLRGWYV